MKTVAAALRPYMEEPWLWHKYFSEASKLGKISAEGHRCVQHSADSRTRSTLIFPELQRRDWKRKPIIMQQDVRMDNCARSQQWIHSFIVVQTLKIRKESRIHSLKYQNIAWRRRPIIIHLPAMARPMATTVAAFCAEQSKRKWAKWISTQLML